LAFGLGRHDFWGTDTSEGHRIVGEIFSLQLCCLFEGRILSQTPAEFRGRVRERVSEVRIHPSPASSHSKRRVISGCSFVPLTNPGSEGVTATPWRNPTRPNARA